MRQPRPVRSASAESLGREERPYIDHVFDQGLWIEGVEYGANSDFQVQSHLPGSPGKGSTHAEVRPGHPIREAGGGSGVSASTDATGALASGVQKKFKLRL